MYLSRLEIVGFKSFANKVHLNFDSGITAIVGPNGCGKTNVVDAIRWALGEQKPSTLRSDKMEDVIFNGTKNRKPIGAADVSLTIENTKGILPSEYSEVTITRRVYRSGESEYYLNKVLCRLKDIRDLFMDTGMGSDAYSVIELKMVEIILSDRTDERRRLFEEAAGVTKYKHRRKEAYRRLESVQQDLVRVNDVVKEVQKAVNSLERQAQKAEKYNDLSRDLRTIEIDLLEKEFEHLQIELGPLTESLSVARREQEGIDSDLSSEESHLESLRLEMQQLESRLTEAQSDLSEMQEKINKAQQNRISVQEQEKSLKAALGRYEKEKLDLGERRKELDARSGQLRIVIGETRAKMDEAAAFYKVKKDELDAFGAQLDAKKLDAKRLQDSIVNLLQRISSKRQDYERIKARIENIHGRLEFSSEETSMYAGEIQTNTELVSQLSAEDRDIRRQFAEAEVRVHQTETRRTTLEQEIESLRNRERDVRSGLERRHSRLDFLKGLVESYDGFSEGAKFLIMNEEWKSNAQTTVADAVATEAQYRIAIEAALGEASGFIVVNNVNEAYRGIELLKQNQKGKATFICLDRIPVMQGDHRRMERDGVIGWARDLVTCNAEYSGLFDYIFDNTLVVRDVDIAAQFTSNGSMMKCVTLDGGVVTSQGLLKGGSKRVDDGGMIGKKNQISELDSEIEVLENELKDVRAQISSKESELRAADVKVLRESAKSIEQKMTSVEMRIAQIEFEKKRINENIERNQAEAVRLKSESDALEADLNTRIPEIEDLEKQRSSVEQESGAAASEIETMEVLWSEYSKVADDARLELMNVENEHKNSERELEFVLTTLSTTTEALTQRDRDIEFATHEIGRLTSELSENSSAIDGLTKQLSDMVEKKKSVDADFNSKREQTHRIELKIKDERRLHDDKIGATHELEMRLSELSMKAENLAGRAKEEFDITLDAGKRSMDDTFDFAGAREKITELKEKIESLGPVNFAAFEEFTTEKQRLEFISTQRNDLLESEKTLIETIEEINSTAQRAFSETFQKIRENFISTFKGLFDEGDECDLKLEDDVDPLEGRIEIIAKPRGKRPTSIDLLSGGEKTLTAIALLFAIYLVKPSPFCILDEVDAPLDDSNIDRFARILRKFSDNTQFIVVTHNKRTMEAANAMYGVTMEEEGVSKLVSVRFNEEKVTQN
jgi:chromosome segregation protein